MQFRGPDFTSVGSLQKKRGGRENINADIPNLTFHGYISSFIQFPEPENPEFFM